MKVLKLQCSRVRLEFPETVQLEGHPIDLLKQNASLSIPEALWQSQQWYRRVDGFDAAVLSKLIPKVEVHAKEHTDEKERATTNTSPSESNPLHTTTKGRNRRHLKRRRQFNPRHPVNWAAFFCVG